MNANEIKFGVELETTISNSSPLCVGGYHNGTEIVGLLPSSPDGDNWKAERDGSIYAPGRRDCEFVSPILQGNDGLAHVQDVVTKINNDLGARVNRTCGVHVTVTFPAANAAALARLVTFVAHFEKGLFAATGSKNRESGSWSKGGKHYGDGKRTNKAKATAYEQAATRDRYHALNLTHLGRGRDRIEFRLFSGSTNAAKIVAWIRLVLAIVEFALNTTRCVSFDSRSQDGRWGGEGECSLVGMFCKLGWLEWKAWGYRGTTYGAEVFRYHFLPTISETVKTLRSMAKKYDAMA